VTVSSLPPSDRLTACAACRWPSSSNPTTVTIGAIMTITRHTAIDNPPAASATDATSTTAVSATSTT
jgi:hypothetical protein